MSTLPPGQGPPVGVGTGALCAPGLVAVSVTVTDCASGANLGTVVPFTVSTSDGQFTTSVNGVVVIQCAADNAIQVFGFDGRALTAKGSIATSGSPTGIRTAQK